jgi:uncharacterized protein (DUF1697 family)
MSEAATVSRCVALLRAINVGGRNIKMEELRAHFTALDFENVSTFIASGNVLFDAPAEDASALERRLEEGLQAALGYRVEAFVRSAREMAIAANRELYAPEDIAVDGSSLYVSFMHRPLSEDGKRRVEALSTADDKFRVCDREVYWWCRGRMSESPLFSGVALAKAIGASSTSRNITTVRKLADRMA